MLRKFLIYGCLCVTSVAYAPKAHAISLGGAVDISNDVNRISGSVGSSDYDLYKLNLFKGMTAAFSTAANFDTQLFLFDSEGVGIRANDDVFFSGEEANLNSRIPTFTAPSSGEYLLAVSGYDYDPVSGGGLIFPSEPFDGVYSASTSSPITGFQLNSSGEEDSSSSSGNYDLFIQRSFPIDIYFDAFIPYDRVFNPFFIAAGPATAALPPLPQAYFEFEGDNRGFELGGSSRMYQAFTIDPFAEDSLLVDNQDTGITTGYPAFEFLFDPVSDKASTEGLSSNVSVAGNQVSVEAMAAIGNPLVPSPVANYDYTLSLLLDNDQLTYELTGDHDGFPAYSVYIGSERIYGHDPRATGDTALSLFPPSEISVNTSGTLTLMQAASAGVGGTQSFPILPAVEAGRFTFENAPSGDWFDPPLAEGFQYIMTGDSFFTDILDFPSGIDGDDLFTVSVGDEVLGNYGPGQILNFANEFGAPVAEFTVNGISPSVDASFGDAFPLRLAFDTPRADFDMIPILAPDQSDSGSEPEPESVPEPSAIVAIFFAGLLGLRLRQKRHCSANLGS